jgi:parallel beta-helix repeat protein
MAMERVFEKSSILIIFSCLIFSFIPAANADELYVYPQQEKSNSEFHTMGMTVMYPNIQAAIDDAVDGDVIYLARGRYKGEGNRDLDFKGKAITLSGLRPEDSNYVAATIIDCNGTEAAPHRGFYFHSGEDNNSVVCGITITNGFDNKIYGSAVYCDFSSPYIHHCNIVSNAGMFNSSTVYLQGSSILENCNISDNSSSSAVYAYGTPSKYIQIKDCIIKNNVSTINNYYCCGIYGRDYIQITNCRIEKNSAGGIYMRGSRSVMISGCQIISNGTANRQTMGAIYGANLIENSTITENIGIGIAYCTEVRNCFIGYNKGTGLSSCKKIINSK